MTWLLLLTPVVAVAVIVWNYRRKQAAIEKATSERFNKLFGKGATQPAASSSSTVMPAPAPAPARTEAEYVVKEKLLTPGKTLLYYLLKTGLPDHEVFARVSLSSLLETAGHVTSYEREAQSRRLAEIMVDFVICDKGMKAVAAVQFDEAGSDNAKAFREKCLSVAGIRVVTITPESLPKRAVVRALVLGE